MRGLSPPGSGLGWCRLAGGLLQLSEQQCEKRGGEFFESREEALASGRSSFKMTMPSAVQVAPPSSPSSDGGGSPRAGDPKLEAVPSGSEGMREFRGDALSKLSVEARDAPRTVLPAAARPGRTGAQASSLVPRIAIRSPRAGEVYDWGGTMTVRYQVVPLREGPGEVTFTLRDPEYRTVATTTHFWEHPAMEEGATIEIVGEAAPTDEPFTLGGDAAPASERMGSFEWTLPARGGLLGGHGFTLFAEKGPHRGASGRFSMLSTCEYGNMHLSVQPEQAVLRQGQEVTVVFAFCGWGGLSTRDQPIYLHDTAVEGVGLWRAPAFTIAEISADRVRGAIRARVPADYSTAGTHVFTLFYGDSGGNLSTAPFSVAPAVPRDDIELTELVHEPSGDIIARAWVGESLAGRDLAVRANDRILMHTAAAGENDIVVGNLPYRASPSRLGPDPDCAEEWDVRLDPGDTIPEARSGNNSLSRVFSRYENAGAAWLQESASLLEPVKRVACDCFDGSPWGACHTSFRIKNCSEAPVPQLSRVISIVQHGTRPRSGGLGTESFSEDVPFTVFIGEDMLREPTLPAGEYATVRIVFEDYRSYDDSTISVSFGAPISAWAGLPNPFEFELNFGSWNFETGNCDF